MHGFNCERYHCFAISSVKLHSTNNTYAIKYEIVAWTEKKGCPFSDSLLVLDNSRNYIGLMHNYPGVVLGVTVDHDNLVDSFAISFEIDINVIVRQVIFSNYFT